MITKHLPGPPMDLANMRQRGVRNLIAYCINDSCRHQALIDVSKYPGDTPVPWFQSKVGARGNRIDVGPNWKQGPGTPDHGGGRPAWEKLLTDQERAEIRARVNAV